MPDESRFGRRRFFSQGLRELLKPLSRAVEPLQEAMRQFGDVVHDKPAANAASMDSTKHNPVPVLPSVWLRPPGALFPDMSFRETCSKCRKCVEVCPVQCIKIDSTGERGNGAPYIVAEEMPCMVCEGLLCMYECPTGALSPIPLMDIDMGTALWNESICVRTPSTSSGQGGENCTVCIDVCPIGEMAIKLSEGKVQVIEQGCIGCGVCQQRCPTEPKSIIVLSREIWEAKRRRG
jgi:ferredoxin-type protein NapG